MASTNLEATPAEGVEPYEGPDLISELSDPLLSLIISFLPTEEAVATSVLSRRWRNLWMFLSRLEFDPWRNTTWLWAPDTHIYIDDVLKKQQNSVITSCRIVHRPDAWAYPELQDWVKLLNQTKGIEELALTVNQTEHHCYIFAGFSRIQAPPNGIFRSRNLRMLELTNYVIEDANPFQGCTNLETLKLSRVGLSNETLVSVIRCLFLDNLIIENCPNLSKVQIRDKRLKKFVLQGMRITKLDLHLDSLIVLYLDKFSCFSRHLFINCPSLRFLQVDPLIRNFYETKSLWSASSILSRISGLVGREEYKLTNLKTLCTCLDLDNVEDNISLRYFFRVSSKLEKLDLTNVVDKEAYSSDFLPLEHAFWVKEEYPDSISHHLKDFRIRGFRYGEREMRLVDYLIRTASKLEKLVIKFDKDVSPAKKAKAKLQILSVPRSSINVSFAFA